MIQPITIPKTLPQAPTLNYDFLREEGIKHIQRLAGHLWTDHNTHDPGITILEQLCYAITDLGYRIDNPIQHLLASEQGDTYRHLFGPASILTVNPVTLLDIRKVVIDVPGVKNAWVEKVTESNGLPHLKGLYRVVFEKNEATDGAVNLLKSVKERLMACRGICEDFHEILQLDAQFIRLHGTIEVGNVEDIHAFAADVLLRVASFISPSVPFYSMQTLLEKGKKMDEIFDGPALDHGFIDHAELIKTARKQEIHISDIIREMMDQPGVLAVNDFSLSTGSDKKKNWVLELDMAKTPKLEVKASLEALVFAKQGLKATLDLDRVMDLYLAKRDELQYEILAPAAKDLVLPETQDRSLEKYFSVQHQFPANYGIGTMGLSESASPSRKAAAKQLSAYLLFFEQLLANYFSQIAHFKDLMGFDAENRKTYFNQSLLGTIPGLEEVLTGKEHYENYLQETAGDSETGLARKNAFLNHLLARFSETFTDYGMLLHTPQHIGGYPAAQKLITDKANFLKDYPQLSGERGKGFNYLHATGNHPHLSGLAKRISRKLGIEALGAPNIGAGDAEGFHVVEHILLRPGTKPSIPSTGMITAFQAASQAGWTQCLAAQHLLAEGTEIRILGSPGFDGVYVASNILQGSFEIEIPFIEPDPGLANASTPQWSRTQTSLHDWVLTDPIPSFETHEPSQQTVCVIPQHGLQSGDRVEITGTEHYDGVFTVTVNTEDSYVIDRTFAGNDSGGRWKPFGVNKDLYSLQLTFVFPEWTDRYQEGNFRRFVENMVREETPAHLTTYVQWLSRTEMQQFEQAYQAFLTELAER